MILRIEQNHYTATQAKAFAGSVHAADFRVEKGAKLAKPQRGLPTWATAAELRLMADLCNSVAATLDSWTS